MTISERAKELKSKGIKGRTAFDIAYAERRERREGWSDPFDAHLIAQGEHAMRK